MRALLHHLLDRHVADPDRQRWENGCFVTECSVCGRALIKPPGLPWRLRAGAT